jgi:outer membrane protein assembly factor BamB
VAADVQRRIYAAIGRKLVALVEEEGQLKRLWEYAAGGNIPGSPVVGGDGRIRIHSGDGELHCLTDKGEQAWTPVQVGEPLGWASPVTDEDSNTWICGYGGGLIKIDPRGGRQGDLYFRTRQKFDSTGLVHRSVFYVGAEDGFLYAVSLDEKRGKNLWDHLADKGKTDWFINSSPAMADDRTLIVAGRDEYLYAFNLEGDQLWKLHLRGQMLASPVVAPGGDVYVGVSLERRGEESWGKLVCVDGQSHKLRWEYRAEGPVESTPVIGDDGLVYFGDNKGLVHAVDADGRAAWKANVGSAVRSCGAIPYDHRLIFGLDNGALVALCCTSAGLPVKGWPKYMRSANQSGMA